MPFYKKLVGEKCYLSPISAEDGEKWTEWLNDLEVALPLGEQAYNPITLDKQIDWINQAVKSSKHIFNIIDGSTDERIGTCLLFDVNNIDRNAKVSILIGEKNHWGKGYGADAMRLILDYGFNLLNLNNIMLEVFSFNKRAIRCYQKVGFREIGRRRQARIIGSMKFDIVMMDILAEEFESVYASGLTGLVRSE